MAERIVEELFVAENGAEFLGYEIDFEEREDGEIYCPVRNKDGRMVEIVNSDGLKTHLLYGFAVESSLGKRYLVDSTSLDDLQATVDRLGQSDGWLNVWSDGETLELTKVKAKSISSISLTVSEEASESIELPLLYLENEPASADTAEQTADTESEQATADKGEADNGANV